MEMKNVGEWKMEMEIMMGPWLVAHRLIVLRVELIVGRKKREGDRGSEKERERDRDRGTERPQTLVLFRKRRSRSQSVACAEVQAGAFKALACLAPRKNLPNGWTLWSVFQDGSNETRTNAVPQEYRLNASFYRVLP